MNALLLSLALLSADPVCHIEAPSTAIAGGIAKVRFSVAGTTDWEFEADPAPDSIDRFVDQEADQVTIVLHSVKAVTYGLRLTMVVPPGKLRTDKCKLKFVSSVNTTPVPTGAMATPVAEDEPRGDPPSSTAMLAYKLAKEMARHDPDDKARLLKEAQIVADVLREGRAKVVERRIETFEELERFTAASCFKKLGKVSFETWKVDWFEEFTAHLDELSAAGSLTIMQNYADVWLEAAKGLERFSGK